MNNKLRVFIVCIIITFIIVACLMAYKEVCLTDNNTKRINSALSKQSIETEKIDLKYWLYTPKNSTDNMPLIIYLHGFNNRGNNLDLLMKNSGFPRYLNNGNLGDIPAYIIMPQLSKEYDAWIEINDSLIELIEDIKTKYNIDANKISLTGFSMGGEGTLDIAIANPTLFSCIAPLSGRIENTDENTDALSDMPVWTFVGTDDNIVNSQILIDFIESLKLKNPDAKITILEDGNHGTVNKIYNNKEINLINWLITNSK